MNNIRLSLEFDISAGKKGWNDFLSYGKNVKEQINGLFIDQNTFKGFDEMGKGAVVSGNGIEELTKKIQLLETQLDKLKTKTTPGSGLPQFTQMSGNARMAVTSFNYSIQDGAYLFTNFRMGMMAISNNVPMLIQGLVGMKAEAKGANQSFLTLIKQSFSGPNALLPVISLLSAAMVILPTLFDDTTEAVDKQKASVDKLSDSYSKLIKAELTGRLAAYRTQLAELEAKNPRVKVPTGQGQYAGTVLRDQTDQERFKDDLTQVNMLRENVKLIEQIILDRGIEEEKTKQIAHWREKIDRMNQNPESKNYWKNLVTDATSYEDAIAKLEASIGKVEKKASDLKNSVNGVKEIESKFDLSNIKDRTKAENELAKLQIENIKDKQLREIELLKFNYKNDVQRVRDEVNNQVTKFKLIFELNKKYLNDLGALEEKHQAKVSSVEADQSTKEEIEKEFNLYKAMYESAADVLRSTAIDAWQDIFGEANSLAEKFGQTLLQIFLDEALRAAARDLFSGAGGSSAGSGFNLFGAIIGGVVGFLGGGPAGAAVGAVGGGMNKAAYNEGGGNYQTDLLNYAVMPNANEVRVVTLQPDMSGVRDEIRSWSREMELKWNYNEWRAGMKALEHRDSYEE